MNGWAFSRIADKYKHCPNCNSNYKDNKLNAILEDDIITISCECGFVKHVNEKNEEVKKYDDK